MSTNDTQITAHLEAEITPGTNLVYCGTFQIVWNQLIDEMNKAPVILTGNPHTAQVLNKRLFEKNEINEACYLAMVGSGHDGIVDKIKQTLKEKFNSEPSVPLNPNADIISYSYLEKNLPFDTVFDVFDEPLAFNGGDTVQSFGISKNVDASHQVEVFDYISPDDFIIKLRASPKMDEDLEFGIITASGPRITDDVILAKVSPGATLFETVNTVLGRIEKEEERLGKGKNPNNPKAWERMRHHMFKLRPESETLQIPKIDFNILHNFTELEGRTISSGNLAGTRIDGAIQSTKFKLDETGAILKSEAVIEMYFGMSPEPRHFIFDKPFLFCLREKGAQHPYLVLWVDNSDLLVKA